MLYILLATLRNSRLATVREWLLDLEMCQVIDLPLVPALTSPLVFKSAIRMLVWRMRYPPRLLDSILIQKRRKKDFLTSRHPSTSEIENDQIDTWVFSAFITRDNDSRSVFSTAVAPSSSISLSNAPLTSSPIISIVMEVGLLYAPAQTTAMTDY